MFTRAWSRRFEMSCIPISLGWKNLYWVCGCDRGYGAQPWWAVWLWFWEKQFYMFFFWDFVKSFCLNFFYSLSNWDTEQKNSILIAKVIDSSENIQPVVWTPVSDLVLALHLVQTSTEQGWGDCPCCLSWTTVILGLQALLVAKAAILGLHQEKHQECCVPLLAGACQQLPADFQMLMAVRLLAHSSSGSLLIPFLSFYSNYGLCCSLWWFWLATFFNSSKRLYFYIKRRNICFVLICYFSVWQEGRQERNISSLTCSKWVLPLHSWIPSLSPALLLFLLSFLVSKNVIYDLY